MEAGHWSWGWWATLDPSECSTHREGQLLHGDVGISLQHIAHDAFNGVALFSFGRGLLHREAEQLGGRCENFALEIEVHRHCLPRLWGRLRHPKCGSSGRSGPWPTSTTFPSLSC